jgi:hypothetical protein
VHWIATFRESTWTDDFTNDPKSLMVRLIDDVDIEVAVSAFSNGEFVEKHCTPGLPAEFASIKGAVNLKYFPHHPLHVSGSHDSLLHLQKIFTCDYPGQVDDQGEVVGEAG